MMQSISNAFDSHFVVYGKACASLSVLYIPSSGLHIGARLGFVVCVVYNAVNLVGEALVYGLLQKQKLKCMQSLLKCTRKTGGFKLDARLFLEKIEKGREQSLNRVSLGPIIAFSPLTIEGTIRNWMHISFIDHANT